MYERFKVSRCEVYGCSRPQLVNALFNTAEKMPELTPPKTIKICAYHEMVTTDPSMVFDVGFTLTREIEIRVGQTVNPPATPEE